MTTRVSKQEKLHTVEEEDSILANVNVYVVVSPSLCRLSVACLSVFTVIVPGESGPPGIPFRKPKIPPPTKKIPVS